MTHKSTRTLAALLALILTTGILFAVPFEAMAKTTVSKPAISVDGGNFTGSKSVKLTCSAKNAKIYYKIGSKPDVKKDKYVTSGKSVKIAKSGKLYAIAVVGNNKSAVLTSKKFTISPIKKPQISVNGGTFTKSKTVNLICDTPKAKIYYKIGGVPDINKDSYITSRKKVKITKSGKLYAVAVVGKNKSKIFISKKFTINAKNIAWNDEIVKKIATEFMKAKGYTVISAEPDLLHNMTQLYSYIIVLSKLMREKLGTM